MRIFLIFLIPILGLGNVQAQEKVYKAACIAFYNVENLFDTIDDPAINDAEYLPKGKNKWNTKKYNKKLSNLGTVISQIGDEYKTNGPVVIGLSEIENTAVLQDLVKTNELKALDYGIIHVDGPDLRGVDVALLYQKKYFTVLNYRSVRLKVPGKEDFFTRDQLVVCGILDGDTIHFIVNHWPSRRGGEKRSAPLRNAAADLCRSQVDSIYRINPNARIIIMGDLNDNPTNASLIEHLKASGQKENAPSGLFNPMYDMFKKDGLGSNAYRDSWSLFDQMVISTPLLKEDIKGFRFLKTHIFNKNFLAQKEGAFAGYPLRTHVGGQYMGGYSDHFPVYTILVKEK